MVTSIKHLSSIRNSDIQTNDGEFALTQFQRNYPGNYNLKFINALSNINDIDTKHYTNFYLTDNYKISDVFTQPKIKTRVSKIYGPLISGGAYLKFSDISPRPYSIADRFDEHYNYGVPVFSNTEDDATNFTFTIIDDHRCNIHYTKHNIKFYLCSDINNKIIFVKKNLLKFDKNNTNPQDFEFIFSETSNNILLYKNTPTGNYSVTTYSNTIILDRTIVNDLLTNTSTSFKLSKNIYDDSSNIPDTSYITYDADNTIDNNKSKFNLSNNILLYKTFSVGDSPVESLILKNQLLQSDIFSSANNLLSSRASDSNLYVNDLREYSSIFSDIAEETGDSLELNYIFYNKDYKISPGTNMITSPASMYPYRKLNVNDTKFVDCGAFSYTTPEFADKIYHMSNDIINNQNGQYLLCTWLSGSNSSDNKMWIDRYYYPDLIDKQSAIAANTYTQSTYDDYIEKLIYDNADISESAQYTKIFDKKSDLIFEPNQNYEYVRINDDILLALSSRIHTIDPVTDLNYFKSVNATGELALAFSFEGDNTSWTVKSNRNNINSGLTLEKNGRELIITYDVYDSTTHHYDNTEYSWKRFSKTVKLEQLDTNFVSVGINAKTDKCYFVVNNRIELLFNLPQYQLLIKHLLYGDFFIYHDNNQKTRLSDAAYSKIYNVIVSDSYIPAELISIIFLLYYNTIPKDIHITLPCGMRNSTDTVELLNSVCGASTFKSDFIDIDINNLNISDKNILDGLTHVIKDNIYKVLPANTNINSINYKNYKR